MIDHLSEDRWSYIEIVLQVGLFSHQGLDQQLEG